MEHLSRHTHVNNQGVEVPQFDFNVWGAGIPDAPMGWYARFMVEGFPFPRPRYAGDGTAETAQQLEVKVSPAAMTEAEWKQRSAEWRGAGLYATG